VSPRDDDGVSDKLGLWLALALVGAMFVIGPVGIVLGWHG